MKSTKVVKIISLIFLSFVTFFGPAFFIQNELKSIADILFSYEINYYSYLIIFAFISLIVASLIEILIKKNIYLKLIEIIFSFYSLLSFSFYNHFFNNYYHISISFSFITYFIFLISILYILKSFSDLFEHHKLSINDIVEIGIFVSLAVVLDLAFFKIRIGAQGGSISLAMLPLFIISLRKGFFKGFVASGIIFGLITCLTDNYGFITYPFDYLLGFGSIAIVGFFNKFIFPSNYNFTLKGLIFLIIGFLISMLARLTFSTISGIVIYGLNFGGSIIYQLTYLGPSAGIVLAILILLYKPLLIINKRYSYINK